MKYGIGWPLNRLKGIKKCLYQSGVLFERNHFTIFAKYLILTDTIREKIKCTLRCQKLLQLATSVNNNENGFCQ